MTNRVLLLIIISLALPVLTHADDSVLFRARIISVPKADAPFVVDGTTPDTLLPTLNQLMAEKKADLVASLSQQAPLGARSKVEGEFRAEFDAVTDGKGVADVTVALESGQDDERVRLVTSITIPLGQPKLLGILQPSVGKFADRTLFVFVHLQ